MFVLSVDFNLGQVSSTVSKDNIIASTSKDNPASLRNKLENTQKKLYIYALQNT